MDRPLKSYGIRLAAVAVAAGSLALTGCQGTPSAAGGSSGTASGTAAKSPFAFFNITTPLTSADNLAGENAAVDAINAAGGIDGHPLQAINCSDDTEINQAVTCARQGISNSAVLSFVDNGSSFGTGYDTLMQQAGIANFGEIASTTADDTSPISFPLYAGTFNTMVSALAATQTLHATSIGVPYVAVPAGAQLPPFIGQLVKGKATVVGVQSIPTTATDYTSYAADEISAKPAIVIDGLPSSMYTSFIQAVRQQGDSSMKFIVATGDFDAPQVKSIFGNDPNIYLADQYDHASPGYANFLSDMAKYQPKAADTNDDALCGWIGVEGFAQILKALISEGHASPTRAEIVSYLNKQADFDVQGLAGGGINFTKPSTVLGGEVPRLFNTRTWIGRAEGGKEVELNDGKPFTLPG